MVHEIVLRNFIENLPDRVKAEERLRAETIQAFLDANPAPAPVLNVQRVDERKMDGRVATTYELVDRRRPTGQRIVGSYATALAARTELAKIAPIAGGAYTLAAVDSDEYFHDTDYEILGNQLTYGVIYGCTFTEDAANMTVDLAVGSVRHSGTRVGVTAATDALTLVSDSSNERWTGGCISSTGTAVLVSGDAAASASVEPTKPEIGDRVLVKLWKIQAGQTIAANCEYALDKRVMVDDPALGIQNYIETSGLKGIFALGAPAALTYATDLTVGMGWRTFVDSTSAAMTGAGTTNVGAWQCGTGATSGQRCGFDGPLLDDAQDWTLVWRGVVPSAASQTWVFGAKTTGSNYSDENGMIAFRVADTGNIIGVCDSAGTETQRDSSATGASECTLRIEVRGGGTIVRFFRNNAQIGADVTTNIPTGNLKAECGIVNSTTADKVFYTFDLAGWREV